MLDMQGFPPMLMLDYITAAIKLMQAEPSFPLGWEKLLQEWESSLSNSQDLLFSKNKFTKKSQLTDFAKKSAVAIAGLSFYPGGIDYLGYHFESNFRGLCTQTLLKKESA